MLDNLIRRVTNWLAIVACVLALSLGLVLWWGGGTEGHVRRLVYSPGDQLFVMELMRISKLEHSEQSKLGRTIAALLPKWCPDRCGDWVRTDNDLERLMWIMEATAYTHESICPEALPIAGQYLQGSVPLTELALKVLGGLWWRQGIQDAFPDDVRVGHS